MSGGSHGPLYTRPLAGEPWPIVTTLCSYYQGTFLHILVTLLFISNSQRAGFVPVIDRFPVIVFLSSCFSFCSCLHGLAESFLLLFMPSWLG